MTEHELMLGVRNILLASFIIAAVVPEGTLLLRRQLARIWTILRTRLAVRKSKARSEKFWEIDMTKFEP